MFLFFSYILCNYDYIALFKEPDNNSEVNEKMAYEDSHTHIMNTYKDNIIIKKKMRNGFIGSFSEDTKQKLEKDSRIAIIEKDARVTIANAKLTVMDIYLPLEVLSTPSNQETKTSKRKNIFMSQTNAPWGISRISSGKKSKDEKKYIYPANAGENVDVYIIDTGIEIDHPEFEGRARWGINLVEDTEDIDEHGHGTHCAGTIAGKYAGIAKKANLVAVKALDKNGAGLISRLMLGIDYIIQEHELKKQLLEERKNINQISSKILDTKKKQNYIRKIFKKLRRGFNKEYNHSHKNTTINPHSIVNMSVGGGKSAILDYAIQYAAKQGIHFSVAAGNDHKNACSYSPGSSKKALTVGATTQEDKIAFFSNYGECVKIFAPGVNITSSWIGKKYKVASGTSMAAPHVSGIMAVYLTFKNYKPKDLMEEIKKDAYEVIQDNDEKTFLAKTWPFSLVFNSDKKYPLASLKPLIARLRNN